MYILITEIVFVESWMTAEFPAPCAVRVSSRCSPFVVIAARFTLSPCLHVRMDVIVLKNYIAGVEIGTVLTTSSDDDDDSPIPLQANERSLDVAPYNPEAAGLSSTDQQARRTELHSIRKQTRNDVTAHYAVRTFSEPMWIRNQSKRQDDKNRPVTVPLRRPPFGTIR